MKIDRDVRPHPSSVLTAKPHWRRWAWLMLLPVVGGIGYLAFDFARANTAAAASVLLPEEPLPPKSARPRLVVTFRDAPPEMLLYSPDQHGGPLRLVIEEAGKNIGYDIEWKPLSFAESVKELEAANGDVDIDIVPIAHFKTPEREKTTRFSVSLGQVPYQVNFIVPVGRRQPIRSPKDLKGLKVGYRGKAFFYDGFDLLTGFERVKFANETELVKAFSEQNLDVIVSNNMLAIEHAQSEVGVNCKNYKYAEMTESPAANLFLLYSRKASKQPIFDSFDKALAKMRDGKIIEKIYRSFNMAAPLNPPSKVSMPDRNHLGCIGKK